MVGCVFCDVAAGTAEAFVVDEDDDTLAFLSSRQAARGHTLVIPRAHAEHLWDIDADAAAAVMRTTHRVAARIRNRLEPDGLTLRQNTGAASGQQVAHLHMHLVPRWHGDGTVGWPWPPADELDLTEVLRTLRV